RNTSGCANTWAFGVPSRARSEQRPQIGRFPTAPRGLPMIAITDFQKVEMRVGMIVDVQDFPEARNPSYKLRVDFGPFGIKRSSSRKPPVATARPLRSPGDILNSERPSRPASLGSSSRKAD